MEVPAAAWKLLEIAAWGSYYFALRGEGIYIRRIFSWVPVQQIIVSSEEECFSCEGFPSIALVHKGLESYLLY